jgi:hypothetical protein
VAIIPIIFIAVLIVGAFAFVFQPLFTEHTRGAEYPHVKEGDARQSLPQVRPTSLTVDELAARRDALYAALKDAEFDRETGKFTDEDYQIVRSRYMMEAAHVLQQLDRLTPEAEAALEAEIERAIAELRSDGKEISPDLTEAVETEIGSLIKHVTASNKHALACPDCGQPYQAGDAFCAHCGASLADTCPECGVPYRPGDAFCARCGARLADEVRSGE